MKARKETERRIAHLQEYLDKSLVAMQYDQLINQMDKHKLSSMFEVTRLLEVFQSILDNEKEQYISEAIMALRNAKEKKRFYWNNLKSVIANGDDKLKTVSEENMAARRSLNQLQSHVDTGKWRCQRIQEGAMQRVSELQLEINKALPHFIKYRAGIDAINAQIEGTKVDLHNIVSGFRKYSSQVQNKMRSKLAKLEVTINSEKVTQLTETYQEERKKTEKQRQALEAIASLINHYMYVEGTTSSDTLTVDDMMDSDAIFRTALRDAIRKSAARAKKMSTSGLTEERSDPKRLRKDVDSMLEVALQKKSNEYKSRITEQKKRMEKVSAELERAESRVRFLTNANSGIDPSMIQKLEEQHSKIKASQNRTDEFMNILFSQGTMSLSEPIDSFMLSPIPKKKLRDGDWP